MTDDKPEPTATEKVTAAMDEFMATVLLASGPFENGKLPPDTAACRGHHGLRPIPA